MIRNERLELFANFVNAVGVGLIAIAVLRPVFGTGGDAVRILLWSLIGLVQHGVAHYILGYMR